MPKTERRQPASPQDRLAQKLGDIELMYQIHFNLSWANDALCLSVTNRKGEFHLAQGSVATITNAVDAYVEGFTAGCLQGNVCPVVDPVLARQLGYA